MSQLYDRAEIYDLLESDRRSEVIREDYRAFFGDRAIRTLLDVSIGTGGMTLPLQELGIEPCGSDLSQAMLERCARKAEAKGKPLTLRQSDFRDLSCWEGRQFDCVMSSGNALGYVDHAGILTALERMDALTRPGGWICFDSRNWEKIQRERQRFYTYNPIFHGEDRINLVQVWDHNPDGSIMFNLLYTFERDNRIFRREIFEERYLPFPKALAVNKLAAMGYGNIEWRPVPAQIAEQDFERVDWYRLIAQKPYERTVTTCTSASY